MEASIGVMENVFVLSCVVMLMNDTLSLNLALSDVTLANV